MVWSIDCSSCLSFAFLAIPIPVDGIFSAPGTLAAGTGAGRHWHQREDRGYQRRLEECRLLCLLGPPHFGDSWDPDSMWQPRALTYVDGPI